MLTNSKRINELLTQYINKTICEKDFSELFELIGNEKNKEILLAFMKEADKTDRPNADVHNVDWNHMYDNIVTNNNHRSKLSIMFNVVQKLAIAASIVFIGFIGFKFYTKKEIQIATAKIIMKQDIAPGSNKAILKLADGSEINLNDVKTGTFSKQGISNVNKTKDGLIEYKVLKAGEKQQLMLNTLSTPRGGQYKLMLPDKSLVWLNSASSITFPTAFVGNQRKVSITGEVYFEVTKNKNKPFVVENGKTKIEVLGTHFNVNVYPNEDKFKATLLEGSIKLTSNKNSKILIPGQQAIFDNENENILIKNIDAENAIDWKNDLFIFENESLTEIMKQVERWYNVDVKYVGQKPSIKFTGIVNRSNKVSKLLKILQSAGNIEFDIKVNTIEVKQKNK